jgi:putative MATE family efflux protein
VTKPPENTDTDLPPNKRDFTQGAVAGHLTRLTGFMMLGLISVMGAALIEVVYIGRVGADALAALSFAFPLVMLFQGIAMGLAVGASSVVARTLGGGEFDKGRLLITHSLLLVMILVILASALAYHNVDAYFELLGAEPHILPLATHYIQLWMVGLPFFTVAMVGSTLMRAAGDAVTPGYLMVIGSVLQVLITPVFVFGWLGAAEHGLQGAAIGFVVARFVSFIMYSYVMVVIDHLLVPQLSGFIASCKSILHVGLPAMASNMVQPLSMSVITGLLASHGSAVVAGFGVASRIESLAVIVIVSQSMSVAPFMGQNWGAARFARVQEGLRLANGLAIAWGVIAYVALYFLAAPLVSSISDDAGVVEAAVAYLRIVPLAIGLLGVLMNSSSCFNALGRPLPPLLLTILQMLVIQVPLALLGNYLWGYVGIFIAAAVTIFILGIIAWFWLRAEMASGIASRTASAHTSLAPATQPAA